MTEGIIERGLVTILVIAILGVVAILTEAGVIKTPTFLKIPVQKILANQK